MEGWISLHRRFLEWEWFSDDKMVKLFIYLLLKANRKDSTWRGVNIKRGQLVNGINTLSIKTNISKQSLRTLLTRLKKTGEINTQSNTRYTIITICNYDSYQDNNKPINTPPNKRSTNDQQTINTPSTTNNTSNTSNTVIKEYKKTLLSELNSDEYNLNEDYLKTAQAFQKLFIKNQNDLGVKNSTLVKAKGTWYDDIRLLIEQDKKTIEECRVVFEYLKKESFWKKIIISTSSLRKYFERLITETNINSHGKQDSGSTKAELRRKMDDEIRKSQKD